MSGFVTWPEGRPELARFTTAAIVKHWRRLGPNALWHGLHGRRICCAWPVRNDQVPIIVARRAERAMQSFRA